MQQFNCTLLWLRDILPIPFKNNVCVEAFKQLRITAWSKDHWGWGGGGSQQFGPKVTSLLNLLDIGFFLVAHHVLHVT